MEEWRKIDAEGKYEVSNLGNVRSYLDTHGRILSNPHPAKLWINRDGYLTVNISLERGKSIPKLVHRLVAKAFISNPLNLPQINHKDEVKDNNIVENLEWCNSKYNSNFGTNHQRSGLKQRVNKQIKTIYQFTLNGEYVREFFSLTEASRCTGITPSHISKAARHKLNFAGNWLWSYTRDYNFINELFYIREFKTNKN